MKSKDQYQIVSIEEFIEATRDSGYKNFGAAVAELIDNSIEAGARGISINISRNAFPSNRSVTLTVQDDGSGMPPAVLRRALQFGGTTRFNSRKGIGRYGMGLPNGSLSQTRRLEVYSWTPGRAVWWSYLDIDKIISGSIRDVPKPVRKVLPKECGVKASESGTLVRWVNCDRIDGRNIESLVTGLHESLGRILRIALNHGTSVTLNGQRLRPIDPLFLGNGNNLSGAMLYGPPLIYDIKVPGQDCTSTIAVTFAELPVERWQRFSNKEKRLHRISKRAGLSVLRSGREIDYGWFFMGGKRKENYDDWWRGEIRFSAELDELFGVTHTKQGIRPSPEIINILSPDIERIAHDLNGRIRRRFTKVRNRSPLTLAETIATERDYLIEPPTGSKYLTESLAASNRPVCSEPHRTLPGLNYRIEEKVIKDVSFFVPVASDLEVVIQINEQHPFYQCIYSQAAKGTLFEKKHFLQALQLLILSAARAECSVSTESGRRFASSLRHSWSNILAAFLA